MPKHEMFLDEKGNPTFLDLETGEIFRKEISLSELADYVRINNRWVPVDQVDYPPIYNAMKARQFADGVLDGIPIREICKQVGVTYDVYCRWRRQYPEFHQLMKDARKDRAEIYFEEIEAAVKRAKEDPNSDPVALGRLELDTYKHLSGTLSPEYNPKISIEGKIGVVPISLETGIRRQGDPGFEEKEIFRSIEEGQKKIEAQESSQVPVQVQNKPEGIPLTEEEMDKCR